jgi:hypothetical protein
MSRTDYYSGEIIGLEAVKMSDADKQRLIDILLNAHGGFIYRSRPMQDMFFSHMNPYFEDKVSLDTAITGLRNQLRIYMSE